jgi:hypothetical protein
VLSAQLQLLEMELVLQKEKGEEEKRKWRLAPHNMSDEN